MKILIAVALAGAPVFAAELQLAGAIKSGDRSAAVEMIARKSAAAESGREPECPQQTRIHAAGGGRVQRKY